MEHMEVQFDLVEKNGGACVTKILSPGAACVIPETLSGLPVTELGSGRYFIRSSSLGSN